MSEASRLDEFLRESVKIRAKLESRKFLLLVGLLTMAGTWLAVVPAAEAQSVEVTTTPSLYPSFNSGVHDYVSRCTPGSPLQVSVSSPSGTTVSVDNEPAARGSYSTAVGVTTGQSFLIVVNESGAAQAVYTVRCLPVDFPTWTSQRTGSTQAQYYVVLPKSFSGSQPVHQYVAIVNNDGDPVWWMVTPQPSSFANLLSDGNIGITLDGRQISGGEIGGGAAEYNLDGHMVGSLSTFDQTGDLHELEQLSNGNYLVFTEIARSGVDLSSWGGPSNASVWDPIEQEFTPTGALVWSWDTLAHISPSEVDPQWYPTILGQQPQGAYDIFHQNSISNDGGNDLLISYRYLNAVVDINMNTGSINWKLGGSTTPQSLAVEGDPVFASGSGFSGQHDARLMPDGSITVFDDGSLDNRPPRAVQYAIDETAKTATLEEQITDPSITSSPYTGSAVKLPGGDWVISWGGDPLIGEYAATGSSVFKLTLPNGMWSYRVIPILPGVLSADTLNADMDGQYPSTATTGTATMFTPSTATLNGLVNLLGGNTTYQFCYGTTTSHRSCTLPQVIASGSGSVRVAADVHGLSPGTTYYFQLMATNANGTTLGTDRKLTTPLFIAGAPLVSISTTRYVLTSRGLPVKIKCSTAKCSGVASIAEQVSVNVKKSGTTMTMMETVVLAKHAYSIARSKSATVILSLTALGNRTFSDAANKPLLVMLKVTVSRGKTVTKSISLS